MDLSRVYKRPLRNRTVSAFRVLYVGAAFISFSFSFFISSLRISYNAFDHILLPSCLRSTSSLPTQLCVLIFVSTHRVQFQFHTYL